MLPRASSAATEGVPSPEAMVEPPLPATSPAGSAAAAPPRRLRPPRCAPCGFKASWASWPAPQPREACCPMLRRALAAPSEGAPRSRARRSGLDMSSRMRSSLSSAGSCMPTSPSSSCLASDTRTCWSDSKAADSATRRAARALAAAAFTPATRARQAAEAAGAGARGEAISRRRTPNTCTAVGPQTQTDVRTR